jgi:hypothetical protein
MPIPGTYAQCRTCHRHLELYAPSRNVQQLFDGECGACYRLGVRRPDVPAMALRIVAYYTPATLRRPAHALDLQQRVTAFRAEYGHRRPPYLVDDGWWADVYLEVRYLLEDVAPDVLAQLLRRYHPTPVN